MENTKLQKYLDRALQDLDETIDVAMEYKQLYYIACVTLDDLLPLEGISWYNYILNEVKQIKDKRLS